MKTPVIAAATALSITAVTVVAFVAPSESASRRAPADQKLSALESRVGALERQVDRMDDRLDALENGSGEPPAPPTSASPSTGPTTGPSTPPASPPSSSPTSPTPTSAGPTSPGPTSTAPPGGFPDAASTGPQGGTSGSRGSITINQDGTVLENTVVTGQITINADHVTIRNVEVRPGGAAYGILIWGDGATITDVAVIGSGRTLAGITAYEGGDFDATRVDVSGTEDGVRMADDCTLVDSYVHDLQGGPESHFDSVTADGYQGWRIEHNTILNSHGQTAAVWIDDPRYTPSSGVLRGNYLAGGGYTVYAGPGGAPGLQVIGNVFSKRYYPRSGYWGPVNGWVGSGNTWSGNVYEGGGTVNP